MHLQIIYNMHKEDSALNNPQWFICHKTPNEPNQTTLKIYCEIRLSTLE